MPARKPLNLHAKTDRHVTRYDERRRAEEALTPVESLPADPPAELKGYPIAESCWRYHVTLYDSLAAKIVTPLDLHALIEYCMGWQYLTDLQVMRRKALQDLKNFKLVISIDTRIDRKGARLDTLRQQLYLTPRSRAGVAPAEKPPEEPDLSAVIPPGGYRWEDLVTKVSKDGEETQKDV
jgi:phage terminase small subunit